MDTPLRLLERLVDGRFHSGAALAERFGISRTAVWKAMRRLGEHGIEVHAVRGRGYRLARPLELLDAGQVRAGLGARAASLLQALEIHRRIDSTNLHLMARGHAGAPGATACLADSQSSGRGRRGRHWHSPFGSGIYLSLLWRYAEGPEVLQGLSLAIGVAVASLLRSYGAAAVGLKWPNDLVCGHGKLGGILVESSGEAAGPCFVVVGIGLNLDLPAGAADAIDQPWTDLARQLPVPPGRNRLAAGLLDVLLRLLAEYPSRGLAPHLADWAELDVLVGRRVALAIGERVVTGISRGIDAGGAQLIDTDAGLRRFHGGEVSLREHS
jgi:BirA family biotin operon repressor/biotin-[acetyl-CoA-carboxylase] ligase